MKPLAASTLVLLSLHVSAASVRAQEPDFEELLDSDDPLRAVLSYIAEREMAAGQVPGAVKLSQPAQ